MPKEKVFSRLTLLEAVRRIEWGDLEVVEGQQPQKAKARTVRVRAAKGLPWLGCQGSAWSGY